MLDIPSLLAFLPSSKIHPKAAANFDVNDRIGYFEINVNKLEAALYSITKAKEVSNFQENNFDLNFVVDKSVKAKDIKTAIEKTDPKLGFLLVLCSIGLGVLAVQIPK